MKGRCTCGAVTYELTKPPLFTNCCHCTWCQRESGAAFGLNALIETPALKVEGALEWVALPSPTKGKDVAHCAACKTALFAYYGGQRKVAVLKVGTLDDPASCPPDIHIYTSTRLPWVTISDGRPQMEEYYNPKEVWPAASLERVSALKD